MYYAKDLSLCAVLLFVIKQEILPKINIVLKLLQNSNTYENISEF